MKWYFRRIKNSFRHQICTVLQNWLETTCKKNGKQQNTKTDYSIQV